MVVSPPIKFQYREDGIFDFRQTMARGSKNLLNFLGQVAFETTSIEAFKPDVVISDSRLSPLVAARMLNVPRILIINQLRVLIPHLRELTRRREELKTLFERIGLEILTTLWNSAQQILVPDFPSPFTISKENLVLSERGVERVRFIGPIIAKRPEELPSRSSLRESLNLPTRKPVVFANYNGTGLEKAKTAELLDPLLEELSNEFHVVISHGVLSSTPLSREANGFKVYNWLPRKFEMLKACDAFITNCGHTSLAEAMYYGAPVLMIPTKGHTERNGNASSVEGFGTGLLLDQDTLCREELRESVRKITREDSYHDRAKEIRRRVSEFKAVDEVVASIRSAIS